jgi:exonuclease SbcC
MEKWFPPHPGDRPEFKIALKKINYPHAPLKKIEMSLSDLKNGLFVEYMGFKTWLEISCNDEEAKEINIQKWTNDIINLGALPGSKITIRKIARETVRAEGIQTAKHLRDKIKVYAEASSLPTPEDSIFEKADKLEKELYQNGSKFHELNIRMKSLHLRGAIGIMKKSDKEEIKIDFENYEPGLIALIGQNGAGKTTLLENLHPYPSLLTRSGKLQDHFQLRDSFRDLYFIDERTGIEYRAFIQIDGQNQSGKCDYNIFRKNNSGTFEPLTNGRAKDYEEKVNELFGSLDLFLKSAFITQKPPKGSPDLSEATKGQRKALFLELAGLEKYQKFSENAKEKRKSLEDSTLKTSGQIEALKFDLEQKEKIKNDFYQAKEKKDFLISQLVDIEKKGQSSKAELEKLEKESSENDKILSEIKQIKEKISERNVELITNDRVIKNVESSLLNKDEHKEKIVLFDSISKKLKDIYSQNEEIRKNNSDLQDSFLQNLGFYDDKINLFKEKIHEKEIEIKEKYNKYINAQQEKIRAEKEIEKLSNEKNCPTCGQELPEQAKRNIQLNIVVLKDGVKIKVDSLEIYSKVISKLKLEKQELENQKANLLRPLNPEYENEIDSSKFQSVLDKINIEESRKIVSDAEQAEFIISEKKKDNLKLASDNEYDKAKLEKLINKYDENIPHILKEVKEGYAKLQDDYSIKKADIKGIEAQIEFLEKALTEIYDKSKKLDELEKETSKTKKEISEWLFLEKACGPDGIQALELDALSPNIESEVNNILRSAYGDRFSIKFETTRIGGTGKNTKQIEDFLIMINDNGHIQELSTLSGGEEVWIKKAIYDAFGIIRNQNTGTNFLTVCMDEADGSLDHESKQQYLKMVQASHLQAGKHHTILITHDTFIQQQIDQKIIMSEL